MRYDVGGGEHLSGDYGVDVLEHGGGVGYFVHACVAVGRASVFGYSYGVEFVEVGGVEGYEVEGFAYADVVGGGGVEDEVVVGEPGDVSVEVFVECFLGHGVLWGMVGKGSEKSGGVYGWGGKCLWCGLWIGVFRECGWGGLGWFVGRWRVWGGWLEGWRWGVGGGVGRKK